MTEEAKPVAPAPTSAPEHQTVYKVKDFVDASQVKVDLAFSDTNLTDAMMTQPAMFAHYGQLLADAARQVDVVKLLLENTEAAVYKVIRDRMANDGEKFTEALLEKMVARHERVIAMKKALNEAKRIESICKTTVEAFRHRRDMLVQMGLISREELKGDIRIMKQDIREEARKESQGDLLRRMNARREGNDVA